MGIANYEHILTTKMSSSSVLRFFPTILLHDSQVVAYKKLEQKNKQFLL